MLSNWAPLMNQPEVECYVAEANVAPTVPPGFAVLDTAALSVCAGDRALRRHEEMIDMDFKEEPSATRHQYGSADSFAGKGTCAGKN